MLQQTQVSRVLTMYPRFLKRFSSFRKLAFARTSDVIRAWQGMGYNNRALRLQKLSMIVTKNHGGKLPNTIPELEALPGIGRYTAHAIASFAFGQHVPIVDTNIRRVLMRLCHRESPRRHLRENDVWKLAESLLPRRHSHDWNQALMDLGSTICTAANPGCDICPLEKLCSSAHVVERRRAVAGRVERGRDGIPNRIYRGRIVQALRELKAGETIKRSALAGKIKPGFKSVDGRWLDSLLKGLKKDGLIRLHPRTKISLPD